MAINFAAIARKETSLSRVMEGREKVKTDYIIENYPDGVTLTEFDIVTVNGDTFPVFAFAENNELCFFGGAVLTNIANEWAAAMSGDIEAASNELKAMGGVKVKLANGKTKKGNSLTTVTVVG